MDEIAELRTRLEVLEGVVREMRALAKGEPGRDGKDGRDGRDGKSVSPQRMAAALRSVNAAAPRAPVVNFAPRIEVQPAGLTMKAPDVHVAAPAVTVSPTIEARMAPYNSRTTYKRDERDELVESTTVHEE